MTSRSLRKLSIATGTRVTSNLRQADSPMPMRNSSGEDIFVVILVKRVHSLCFCSSISALISA